jgi:hypothetical protein
LDEPSVHTSLPPLLLELEPAPPPPVPVEDELELALEDDAPPVPELEALPVEVAVEPFTLSPTHATSPVAAASSATAIHFVRI